MKTASIEDIQTLGAMITDFKPLFAHPLDLARQLLTTDRVKVTLPKTNQELLLEVAHEYYGGNSDLDIMSSIDLAKFLNLRGIRHPQAQAQKARVESGDGTITDYCKDCDHYKMIMLNGQCHTCSCLPDGFVLRLPEVS